jgi:UDP-glucose 4-epimerase
MNVLITGVAGLLGARLADWIVDNIPNANVVGIDDLSGGYLENVNPKVTFCKLNLAEQDFSRIFDEHKFDYVFHFAAYAAEGVSPFIREFNYRNNLISTAKVVNNCVNFDIKRLVFTSSLAVYGVGNPPFSEDDNLMPIDPYGVAKMACEQDIQIAGWQHNLDWCIIRPHNVYGIKQNIWDKYRNVLGIWMYQHLNGMPMTIFGDGLQKRAFSYIDDCLAPLWNAATRDSCSKQIINLGATKEVTIKEANDVLREIIGGGDVIYAEPRHEVKYSHPTHEKSVKLLDYKDETSLEDALTSMWEWARIQPMRERFVWKPYEIEKGVYSYWKT